MIERTFGAQAGTFRPPALFHFVLRGDVNEDEVRGFVKFITEHAARAPHVLVLADLGGLRSISPEASKVAGDSAQTIPYRIMAFYNAGIQARVVVTFAVGAMRFFSPRTDREVRFFDTEAEARVWIEVQHRDLYPDAK